MEPYDFEEAEKLLSEKFNKKMSPQDTLSYAMYPKVSPGACVAPRPRAAPQRARRSPPSNPPAYAV